MIVLAGDVGGTKVDLGLFSAEEGDAPPALRAQGRYSSRDHPDLESLCSAFLRQYPARPAAAAFGIAGPIGPDRVATTNLPWTIERAALEAMLSCPVALVNDLESTAHGIAALEPHCVLTLNEGDEVPRAPRAILAAGTGLGEGYMVWSPRLSRYRPFPSEGGHADFAPRDEEQMGLLRHLLGRHRRVSVERVVSGEGIVAIFEHLAASGRHPSPAGLLDRIAPADAPAAISGAALGRAHPVCVETMRLFAACYGAEAGNLALKILARGGVYVGGGIAPKILPLLSDGVFMRAFLDKGRFAALMSSLPVRIILDETTSLRGAASVARELAMKDVDGRRPHG